jgi:hypothetical protein
VAIQLEQENEKSCHGPKLPSVSTVETGVHFSRRLMKREVQFCTKSTSTWWIGRSPSFPARSAAQIAPLLEEPHPLLRPKDFMTFYGIGLLFRAACV